MTGLQSFPQQSRHWFLPDGRIVEVVGGRLLGRREQFHPNTSPMQHDDVAHHELRRLVAASMGFDLQQVGSWPLFALRSGRGLPDAAQRAQTGLTDDEVAMSHWPHAQHGDRDLRLHAADVGAGSVRDRTRSRCSA